MASIPEGATQVTGYLAVAADNTYTVELNGQVIGADSAEVNFSLDSLDVWSLDAALARGSVRNSLSLNVTDMGVVGGLIYKARIQYCPGSLRNSGYLSYLYFYENSTHHYYSSVYRRFL
jgi:hypothetical protein